MNITLQYIILSAIIVAALIYMARGLRRKKGDNGRSCAGCAFSDGCRRKSYKEKNDRKHK